MDGDIVALILAPLIIFLIFVAPIWLILHYRSKKQVSQGLSAESGCIAGTGGQSGSDVRANSNAGGYFRLRGT